MSHKNFLLFIFMLLFVGVSDVLFVALHTHDARYHKNPCTENAGNCYSIQGLYSIPGCPGQRIENVEVDGKTFFLECQ